MKKIYRYFAMAALAVMCLAVASCDEYKSVADNGVVYNNYQQLWKITVQGKNVSDNQVTIALGETAQLGLTIVQSNDNYVKPVWMSSDESVVTVSEDGLLTAVKTGEATIHAYWSYNDDIFADLKVKVSGGAVGISKKLVDQKDAD